MLSGVDEIIAFWFGDAADSAEALAQRNALWFGGGRELDHEVRARFETTIELAATGACGHWAEKPRGLLALILLFDQFPRNIHRGTRQAFEHDEVALRLCREGIVRSLDRQLSPLERIFVYMPLQHAEDSADQALSVKLSKSLLDECPAAQREYFESSHRYAVDHHDIIARFRRFPHRNTVLGRESTAEEREHLQGSPSPFGQ
jgi:uncharacterized protein (DUF924 family)